MLRRFVLPLFTLLAVAAVIYAVLFTVLVKWERDGVPLVYRLGGALNQKGGNSWQKFQEYDPHAPVDLLFIGSSHAYRGYDPRIFARHGNTSFNLGTSAQSPLNTRAIIRHVVDPKAVKLLVIDVYEGAFATDGLESTADLTQNCSSDAAATEMVWHLKDPRGLNMLALRHLRRDAPAMYRDSAYVEAGFSQRTDSLKTVAHTAPMPPVQSAQRRHFQAMLKQCHARSMRVVLVDHPKPSTADRERHAQWAEWVRTEAEHYGIPFIDLAFDHGLPIHDLHHFYDHNHLNQAGVELFNARLIDELERRGLLGPSSAR
ncbi:MAG: SGNH/GDSL hydrolase family protein [Flavobacteriales bacterium]|nr:SGNH/GDSL hydrolase family protein [Flavobacteriales bacterium]